MTALERLERELTELQAIQIPGTRMEPILSQWSVVLQAWIMAVREQQGKAA